MQQVLQHIFSSIDYYIRLLSSFFFYLIYTTDSFLCESSDTRNCVNTNIHSEVNH